MYTSKLTCLQSGKAFGKLAQGKAAPQLNNLGAPPRFEAFPPAPRACGRQNNSEGPPRHPAVVGDIGGVYAACTWRVRG